MSTNQDKMIREYQEVVHLFIDKTKGIKDFETEVLSTQPDTDSWSILECYEHLNRYSDFYLKEFKKALKNGGSPKEFSPGWLGKKSADSMLPEGGEVKNKMKTFKSKNPALDNHVSQNALDIFIQDQEEMLKILERSKRTNLNKRVKTTLPLLRFKLGDCLAFYINHEQRHMAQIERTLKIVQSEVAA